MKPSSGFGFPTPVLNSPCLRSLFTNPTGFGGVLSTAPLVSGPSFPVGLVATSCPHRKTSGWSDPVSSPLPSGSEWSVSASVLYINFPSSGLHSPPLPSEEVTPLTSPLYHGPSDMLLYRYLLISSFLITILKASQRRFPVHYPLYLTCSPVSARFIFFPKLSLKCPPLSTRGESPGWHIPPNLRSETFLQ